MRKGQYPSNKEPRIRDDTSQNSHRKKKHQESMTGLLGDSVETPRNPRKNTNRSRVNVYEQGMRGLHEGDKHTTRQTNGVPLKVQRTGRKSKQRNKKISPKIHKSPTGRLEQMALNLGIRIQRKITGGVGLLFLSNGI